MISQMYENEIREIPFKIKLLSFFNGFSTIFGWIFFGVGMIFVWFFIFSADFSTIFPENFDSTAQGNVIGSIPTTMSENNRRILKIKFRFIDSKGEEHFSYSYSKKAYPYDEKVTILYNIEDPKTAKIESTRTNPFGPTVLFVLIFPIIGITFITISILKGLKINRLLKYGSYATGILNEKKATVTRINGRRVYRFKFLFKDRLGQEHTITEKTHLTSLLTGTEEKPLLYLSEKPEYGIMLDLISGYIKFRSDGKIEFRDDKISLTPLILPLVVIASNILAIYIRFFL